MAGEQSINFDRVLTTGGSGMIGAYIDFGLKPDIDELDVTNESQVSAYITKQQPEVIIHLAAAADMKRCEAEPQYAYDINVRGTYNVARAARDVGATTVFVSTSRVFRGDKTDPYTETDVPEPDTYYGRTKHIGELIVRQLVENHIIARTAWVFGGGPKRDNKFYGTVLHQLQSDVDEIVALNDVHGSPTYGKDLIETVTALLKEGVTGTYHITNSGTATRYDIACVLVDTYRPGTPVRAVDRSYFPGAGSLPTNEAVVSDRVQLRPWQDALTEYLTEEWVTENRVE